MVGKVFIYAYEAELRGGEIHEKIFNGCCYDADVGF